MESQEPIEEVPVEASEPITTEPEEVPATAAERAKNYRAETQKVHDGFIKKFDAEIEEMVVVSLAKDAIEEKELNDIDNYMRVYDEKKSKQ